MLEPELMFRSDGSAAEGPVARFIALPHKSLLTLGIDAPESWLVESVSSVYDLDNILLEEVNVAFLSMGGRIFVLCSYIICLTSFLS